MIKPTRIALAELWLKLHPGLKGMALGALFVLPAPLFEIPIGPPTRLVGIVDHIGLGGRTGSDLAAFARLPDGRMVQVRVYLQQGCAVGGPIHVVQQRYPLGLWIRPELDPCPGWERR